MPRLLLPLLALASLAFALSSCAGGCGCGHKNDLGSDAGGPRVVNFVSTGEEASN